MANIAVAFNQRQMQKVRTLEVKCDFLNGVKVDTRCNNMMLITSVDGLIN